MPMRMLATCSRSSKLMGEDRAMNRLEYPVIVSPLPLEEGGGFVATVPDLPGCW